MANRRLFIAIDFDSAVNERIISILPTLKRNAASFGTDIRWTRPGTLHLTLKFLGETEEEKISEIVEVLTRLVTTKKSFSIAVKGAGAFPAEHSARVIWIGINDADQNLIKIAEAAEAALVPLGFARENRTFSPHLTVGRLRAPRGVGKILSSIKEISFGESIVRDLVLYESQLKPSGAEYHALKRFTLP